MYWRTSAVISVVAIFCCLICGCSVWGGDDSGGEVSEGLTEITPDVAYNAGFEEAYGGLEVAGAEGMMGIENFTLYSIIGAELNSEGRGKAWILEIKKEGAENSTLLIFSGGEWIQAPWSEGEETTPLMMDFLTTPDELFSLQKSKIEGFFASEGVKTADLELSGDRYTLILRTPGGFSEYKFDAITGEMIP